MSEPRRFRHQPKRSTMLAGTAFFGACAAFAFFTAARNHRGLIVNHLVELGPDGADLFWGVIGLLSLGFVILGLNGVARSFGAPQYVVLTDEAIELPPAPFRRGERIILYRDVRAVELWESSGQKSVRIVHGAGADGVAHSMVGEAAFQEIVAELRKRCRSSP